ncbi:hypothetical protein NBRC116493_10910 [Aurantivibrio infirmus]
MKSVGQQQTRPEKIHDAVIVNDIITICRDGKNFYRQAAQAVDDQALKNIFNGMADIRQDLVDELEPQVTYRGIDVAEFGSISGTIKIWYINAKEKFGDFGDRRFISQLTETESRTLNVMKAAVKAVDDNQLAGKLSSKIASIQMTYDRMKALKDQSSHH